MNKLQEYNILRKLKEAQWLLNAVDIAFRQTQAVEEFTFKRISEPKDEDTIKIFLTGRDKELISKFIADTDKLLKSLEKPK